MSSRTWSEHESCAKHSKVWTHWSPNFSFQKHSTEMVTVMKSHGLNYPGSSETLVLRGGVR